MFARNILSRTTSALCSKQVAFQHPSSLAGAFQLPASFFLRPSATPVACQKRLATTSCRALATETTPRWDYEKFGPSSWSCSFPDGAGLNQSPINIDTSAQCVRYDVTLSALSINYDQSKITSIANVGHSFQINFDIDHSATVEGGPLQNEYQLIRFSGHWGRSSKLHGSEHTINNRSFPAELHFIHFNKLKYANVEEALKHQDGLAIVAVFLTVCPKEKTHPEMQHVVDLITNHLNPNMAEIEPEVSLKPSGLMAANLEHYFTYPGSLTTPPLSECVTWLVLADPVQVSSQQLQDLRSLERPVDGKPVEKNYRPVMPVNRRIVWASFPNYADHTTDGPILD